MRATLKALARVLPIEPERHRAASCASASAYRAFVPIPVRENLSWDQVATVEVNSPDLPGVSIEVDQTPLLSATAPAPPMCWAMSGPPSENEVRATIRCCSCRAFASARAALEKQYDDAAARHGRHQRRSRSTRVGRVIRELDAARGRCRGRAGLTARYRPAALRRSSAWPSEQSASAVVLDVITGDVLALGSHAELRSQRLQPGPDAARSGRR